MDQFNMFFGNNANGWMIVPLMVWVLFWKGYSLWTAVRNNQKTWFAALLVFNTLGILEIIYIFFIAKKNWGDIKRILFWPISKKK